MLNANLKKYRKMCGFNQQDVANLIGLDRSAYSYYESGKTEPNIQNLVKMARMFNISVDALVGNEAHSVAIAVASENGDYTVDISSLPGKISEAEKQVIALMRQVEEPNAVLEQLKAAVE